MYRKLTGHGNKTQNPKFVATSNRVGATGTRANSDTSKWTVLIKIDTMETNDTKINEEAVVVITIEVEVVKVTVVEVIQITVVVMVTIRTDKIKPSLGYTWPIKNNHPNTMHHFNQPPLRVFSTDRLQSGPCKRSTLIISTC